MAYARDEVVVLDAEETTEEEDVVTDAGDESSEELETVEEDTDALEQPEPSNEVISTQADDIVESGTWGTCPWTLSSSGVLTVMPGEGINPSSSYEYPWHEFADSVTAVHFTAEGESRVVLPPYSHNMFVGFTNAASFDLSVADTSNVICMDGMFRDCSSATSINLSDWDTSNTKQSFSYDDWNWGICSGMLGMFEGCTSLESIDLSGWKLGALTPSFHGLVNLRDVNLTGWDTSRVGYIGNEGDMNGMFENCSSLTSLDLSGWDLSNVQDARDMFTGCTSLTSLDLSGWQLGSFVPSFSSATNLESIDTTGWKLGTTAPSFHGLSKLSEIKGIENWDVSNLTTFTTPDDDWGNGMFYGCSSLTSLDLSGWDTSNVTTMDDMFYGCSSLTSLDISEWDTSKAMGMGDMFWGCSSLTSLDLSRWNTSKVTSGMVGNTWYSGMQGMFNGCAALKTLNLSGWDASKANMDNMFMGCTSLETLNLSGWKLRDDSLELRSLFWDLSNLKTIDLTGWNLGAYAPSFSGLDKLTEIKGISDLDTSQVANLSEMFSNCSSLESLDLSKWDTSNVTDMTSMFESCTNLVSLDVSTWNTANVHGAKSMFSGCFSLESLDLSNWDTSKITSVESMFASCAGLGSIKVGQNYKIRSAEMFPNATSENDQWWSESTAQWYSKNQIVRNRSGVADTYTAEQDPEVKINIAGATILNVSAQKWTGGAIEPKPLVKLSGKYLTEGTDYELAYSNNVGVGEATITITGTGSYTGTASTAFQIEPVSMRLVAVSEIPSQTYTGNAIEPKPVVTLQDAPLTEGEDYELHYYSNVNAGTAAITITGKSNYSGAISIEFEIEPVSLGGTTISAIEAQTYTGKALTPKPQVSLGGRTLTEGVDYTLAYANNVEVGTATITATGRGNYADEKSVEFKIEAPAVEPVSLKAAVVAPIPQVSYTGNAIEPKPVISVGNRLLAEGVDYELSYSNNVNAGEATVTATGKGDCIDSIDATFVIEPASIKLATIADIPTQTYTGNVIEPKPAVTLRSATLVEGTDYEIRYFSNVSAGTAVAVISGTGNYQGEKAVAFQIKAPDAGPVSLKSASIAPLPNQPYTGEAVTPKPTVTANGRLLVEGTDYDLTYDANTNAGTATITIAGKGGYVDTTTATFAIEPASLADASVSGIDDVAHTGNAVEPKPTVMLNNSKLVAGTDYELRYFNNVIIGTALAFIIGRNNYKGTQTIAFQITATPLSNAQIVPIAAQTYTGSAIAPKPRVTLNGIALREGIDYTLSYKNNVNAGTASVTVTGNGNYTGTKTVTFAISKAPGSLTAKAKKKSVKLAAVKKKAQKVAPITVAAATGAVSYAKVAKGSSAQLSVAKKTGKVTVKKGTKKGTYTIKIKVTAAGDANHLSASKVVKAKVVVK
ncbi:MAG: BspA family leucine-rich repeat surface protein [Atopobiaceae bacterium]|nr:BspA family leucine-rich repeat surface protein [Atopobiaceae bacterium]